MARYSVKPQTNKQVVVITAAVRDVQSCSEIITTNNATPSMRVNSESERGNCVSVYVKDL